MLSLNFIKTEINNSENRVNFACFTGYPKVAEILLGRLLPKSKKHRQAISKAAKHIYQRLNSYDVTPYLLKKEVINRLDVEEIKAKEARCEAALELLLQLLPNRSRQWYCFFIEALVESGQSELAELIDKEMAQGNVLIVQFYT